MQSKFKLRRMTWALVPVFGLALAMPAYAADDTKSDRSAQASKATAKVVQRNVRASELIGKDVRNAQGEDLGDIKDLIIDMNNSRVHYAVLSFGGFLGLGDKLFAFPMSSFRPTADKDELILNVDRAKLKNAPGFEDKNWPDWGRADYRNQVDRYYSNTIKPRPNMRLVRASKLIGWDVNGADGKDLGEIEDVVVNLADGSVRYAVLEFDKSWSLNDKLFMFPLRQFRAGPKADDDLTLNVTREMLDRVPGFDKNKWPSLNDPKWSVDVDRYWATTTVTPLPSASNDALFRSLDTNNDGTLSAEEAQKESRVHGMWGSLDRNNDGRVTRAEFDARYKR